MRQWDDLTESEISQREAATSGARADPQGKTFAWVRALRLHQWAKNLLVFIPLLTAHLVPDRTLITQALLAFFCFGVCASASYLINDIVDREADRAHPRKRMRPFASGELAPHQGVAVAAVLFVAGFSAAWFGLNVLFFSTLVLYVASTHWYSFVLKRIAMVDVLVLAGLYTLRLLGGSAAMGIAPSFWLLSFSMFLFLSLAVAKRYAELSMMLSEGRSKAAGRDYSTADLPLMLAVGVCSGLISVLVLALYVHDGTAGRYKHPELLWLICPLMLYWVCRVWRKTHRRELHDDPVVFAIVDRPSTVVAGAIAALVWVAS
ncbi:MAG: UbiA family prenyltransferase [Steroidobacteraceae bacterium]|nr:UbiA family prenyltransferase [Steroidobacteraceae bacterium]